ncbi:hypothetical protein CHLNCDRAFT_143270 [Chlorella variabilis]|uniref:Uncharacterized protein n=1 Tax=Chlorella variabilis TaxID=554065 RepID=E1Z9V0_CHLVA|nr:hypothetical protein CHLNCDRAFT_143270 [Chlorella variabilis]EFN57587.1 hypothetical protein CHLNCDRAFT_143270 [Chlorella variabilis]|eukprot:XP_005849689.1 hypothetical protein CHLNCDRAFT_143270 [Chlorella variabilis]
MLAVPSERYEVDPELAKALEIIFILHLDHEQNASTSTVRTAVPSDFKDQTAFRSNLLSRLTLAPRLAALAERLSAGSLPHQQPLPQRHPGDLDPSWCDSLPPVVTVGLALGAAALTACGAAALVMGGLRASRP